MPIPNLPEIPRIPAVPNISVIPSIPSVPEVPFLPISPLINAAIQEFISKQSLFDIPSITIPANPLSALKSKLEAAIEGKEKEREQIEMLISKGKRVKEGLEFIHSKYTFDTVNSIAEDRLKTTLNQTKSDASTKIRETVQEAV